ncbi:MAG: DUF4142 domain-containing protein [Sphingobium sp.]
MTRSALITVSMAALTLASCGKKTESVAGNNSVAPTNITTENTAPAVSAGQMFANKAAASDSFEIEASKLAAASAASAATKSFAQSMIKAHTDSTTKLKAAATSATPAITPDPTLDAAQVQALEALKGKEGAAFDAAYADAQVKGHQATLDALKVYAASGEVPSLKGFAATMVPIVTAHLNMANGLKR